VSVPVTSGTYNFAPGMGEAVLYCYGMCGVRRTAITQSHMEDARMATNMLMSAWNARGVNLWSVDLVTLPLIQGVSTYPVPPSTTVILDAYIQQNSSGATIDRLIFPISRSEYASYSNKTQQGGTTSYWFDRLLAPTITLWPVPNNTAYALKYYRLRQAQDSVYANGTSIEIPVYWWDAFTLGLGWRLALIWAPDRAIALKPLADEAYTYASTQNVETSAFMVTPMIGGYYR
jgi:hypothetical protein